MPHPDHPCNPALPHVVLLWAEWAVPSLPARLSASELAHTYRDKACIHQVDVSLPSAGLLELFPDTAVEESSLPGSLPSWLFFRAPSDARGPYSVADAALVISRAVPKFEIAEAIDQLIAG